MSRITDFLHDKRSEIPALISQRPSIQDSSKITGPSPTVSRWTWVCVMTLSTCLPYLGRT